jgi:hypothetical protein
MADMQEEEATEEVSDIMMTETETATMATTETDNETGALAANV